MRYVLVRLLRAVVSLLAIASVAFALSRASGSPVALMAGENATNAQLRQLTAQLGLNRPLIVQYAYFLGDLVRGDLGRSIYTGSPVLQSLLQRLGASVELGLVGALATLVVALPLGMLAASRRNRMTDWLARIFAMLGQAVPPFWLAVLLVWAFAIHLHWFPAGGQGGAASYVLPALTVAWFTIGAVLRLMRSATLEALHSEYVRFARSKGLPEFVVLWRHAARNALLPVVTFTSLIFVALFVAGSVVSESIFNWPGMGESLLTSARMRDYPMVQGIAMMYGCLYVLVNLLVDLLYGYLDPRVRRST